MFSSIDVIVFPNSCEVIQLTSQQFVFPIMKNGSSSFYGQIAGGNKKNWKILKNEEILHVNSSLITFIRDPRQRFISGVNTFLYHCHRDNPSLNLDDNTIMWFVDKYLFLDRHYAPQFYWLINLSRYCQPDTLIDLRPMSDLDHLAGINHDARVPRATDKFKRRIEQFNWKQLELYFYLDQILYDHIGQSLTYQQILDKVKKFDELYKLVFDHSKIICRLV